MQEVDKYLPFSFLDSILILFGLIVDHAIGFRNRLLIIWFVIWWKWLNEDSWFKLLLGCLILYSADFNFKLLVICSLFWLILFAVWSMIRKNFLQLLLDQCNELTFVNIHSAMKNIQCMCNQNLVCFPRQWLITSLKEVGILAFFI